MLYILEQLLNETVKIFTMPFAFRGKILNVSDGIVTIDTYDGKRYVLISHIIACGRDG